MSNLPLPNNTGPVEVKTFFDKFYQQPVNFPSDQIDAIIGYFLKHGFDLESARSTSIVLLNQAKLDNVDVFQLIETLKALTDVQLSQVVAQILNAYRENTSLLGYRVATPVFTYEHRNILV